MSIPKNSTSQHSHPQKVAKNPYIGQSMDPGLARILEVATQGAAVAAVSAGAEQDDGGDGGGDDDIRYGVAAGYVCGIQSPSLLKSTNPDCAHPILPGSALPPSPIDDEDYDMTPVGIYDGLAKLAPDTIVDKTQLANMFGVSEKTIRRRIDAGELPPPHMRMRRQPQWFVGVLLDWLKDKARGISGQEDARRQHIRDKTE